MLQNQLSQELNIIKSEGKYKDFRLLQSPMGARVRMEGRGNVLILSSNNYLGLADNTEVIEAGIEALKKYGAGTASVRFICGYFEPHRKLESAIAEMHGCAAALTYPSCWQANTGVIPAITGEGDVIISDSLNHASIIDGCRMSKAKRMVYSHSNLAELEERLIQAKGARRILVITDGVFSMEGAIAKLPELIAICKKHDAILMVDDCHGVGVLGKNGRGTLEHFDSIGKVDIVTGTLGKALGGAAGGYVAGSVELIDYLNQVSRPQLFSNALPATVAASANKAIEVMLREPQRLEKIRKLANLMRSQLRAGSVDVMDSDSAIVPVIVGETAKAIALSKKLLEEGIFVTGFGFPVVPEGTARLRIQISAALSEEDVISAASKIIANLPSP